MGDSDRIQPFTESSEFLNQSKCSYVKKKPPCGASANHPDCRCPNPAESDPPSPSPNRPNFRIPNPAKYS